MTALLESINVHKFAASSEHTDIGWEIWNSPKGNYVINYIYIIGKTKYTLYLIELGLMNTQLLIDLMALVHSKIQVF